RPKPCLFYLLFQPVAQFLRRGPVNLGEVEHAIRVALPVGLALVLLYLARPFFGGPRSAGLAALPEDRPDDQAAQGQRTDRAQKEPAALARHATFSRVGARSSAGGAPEGRGSSSPGGRRRGRS